MVSIAEKKIKVSELIEKDKFEDIIMKPIKNKKGVVGVPRKYLGHNAIIIIETKKDKEGKNNERKI